MKKVRQFFFTCAIFIIGAIPFAQAETSSLSDTLIPLDQKLNDVFKKRSLGEDDFIKYRIGGQARYRFEYRDDFNFNRETYEDDGFHLLRTRLNLELDLGEYAHLFAQAQDSQSFASRGEHESAGFENQLDLHQLYTDVRFPHEDIPLKVRVGRQKLAYGDQRFVGDFEWSNVARVFDAVKLVFNPIGWFSLDAWFSQVVIPERSEADHPTHKDNFWGLYGTIKPITDHAVDAFLFIRESRNADFTGEITTNHGNLEVFTYGNRAVGKKAGFDYGFEWAIQGGERASEDIEALALHARIGYTVNDADWKPRLSFEYNHGSGDSNPTDGKVETFDNLFPTNHLHYGYMDFFSLRNTHNFRLGFDMKPHMKLHFQTDFHWFYLDTASGALQNAGGAVLRAGKAGASTSVGKEIDLLSKWKASERLSFLFGYSHFFAGAFIEDTGASSDADFLYVESVLNF